MYKHDFSENISYNRPFQKVVHKVGESEINHIKILQNSKALEISVGNIYSGDQLMNTFLYNLQKGGIYSTQIASHQPELRREQKFVNKKSLYLSALKIDYLNLDNSVRDTQGVKISHSQ